MNSFCGDLQERRAAVKAALAANRGDSGVCAGKMGRDVREKEADVNAATLKGQAAK